MQKLSQLQCSCIVPFYNEGARVAPVIKALQAVKSIDKIICVDDGSDSSETADFLKKKFKNILVVRLPKNKGKSEAVKFGLEHVTTPYVILVDADLSGIRPFEIDDAIRAITMNPSLGMIILKRIKEPWYIKATRWDTLVSGERVLHSRDLKKIYAKDTFSGNQIEYAINRFMMENGRPVRWAPSSAENIYKVYKYGFFRGAFQDIVIHCRYILYAGIWFSVKSYLFFCKKKIEKSS